MGYIFSGRVGMWEPAIFTKQLVLAARRLLLIIFVSLTGLGQGLVAEDVQSEAAAVHPREPGNPVVEVLRTPLEGGTLSATDIALGQDGEICLATRAGAVLFDGERWTVMSHPHRLVCESVAISAQGRIFAGFNEDFGEFEPRNRSSDSDPELFVFRSLRVSCLPGEVPIGRCSEILIRGTTVCFGCDTGLAEYSLAHPEASGFVSLAFTAHVTGYSLIRNSLIAGSTASGWFRINGRETEPLLAPDAKDLGPFQDSYLIGCCEFGEHGICAVTFDRGLGVIENGQVTLQDSEISRRIARDRAKGINRIATNQYVVCTARGMLFFNSQGLITDEIAADDDFGAMICRNSGTSDGHGGLWVPIIGAGPAVRVNLGSRTRRLGFHREMPQWISEFGGVTLMATSGGICRFGEGPADKTIDSGIADEVISPDFSNHAIIVGSELLVATMHGLGVLRSDGQYASRNEGRYLLSLATVPGHRIVLAGTLNQGIVVYRRESEEWNYQGVLPGTGGLCLDLNPDAARHTLWFLAEEQGGGRSLHSADIRSLTSGGAPGVVRSISLPGELAPTDIELDGNRLLVNSSKGLFELPLTETADRVPPNHSAESSAPRLQKIRLSLPEAGFLSDRRINAMTIDVSGNLWLATANRELFRITAQGRVSWPRGLRPREAVSKMFANPDQPFVWLATNENRIVKLSAEDDSDDTAVRVRITAVHTARKRIAVHDAGSIVLPLSSLPIQFDFASSSVNRIPLRVYQHRLEGLQTDWSAWNDIPSEKFDSLPPGTYRFEVRTRGRDLRISEPTGFSFRILPPWYNTLTAWAGYLISLTGFVFGVIKWRTRRSRRQIQKLEQIVAARTSELLAERSDLEKRVVERTSELRRLNDSLVREADEHQQTARRLYESELHYRSIVEDQREMIVRFNPAGLITFCNEAYARAGNRHPQELIGTSVYQRIHPDDVEESIQVIAGITRQNPFAAAEFRVVRDDGQVEWAEWNGRGLFDSDGKLTGYQAVGRNITALRRAEARLREKEQQLAHIARVSELGEMVAGISHEINQPLASIANFSAASRLLLQQPDVPPQNRSKLVDWTERISKQTERISGIIQRLRRFSRPGSQRERFSIAEAIREALLVMESRTRFAADQIQVDVQERLPQVFADRIQIEQVIVNLIRNACDAMSELPKGSRRLQVNASELDGSIVVQVRDSGPGVSPEDSSRIFDAFVTSRSDGVGIGLAISRTIIEAHGGTIRVVTSHSCGLFEFTLPLGDSADE